MKGDDQVGMKGRFGAISKARLEGH